MQGDENHTLPAAVHMLFQDGDRVADITDAQGVRVVALAD